MVDVQSVNNRVDGRQCLSGSDSTAETGAGNMEVEMSTSIVATWHAALSERRWGYCQSLHLSGLVDVKRARCMSRRPVDVGGARTSF
jgi:hypothetical protein